MREKLIKGLVEQNLTLPDATIDKLLDYLVLMNRWNKVYNLTAVRDMEQMISRHLLDSLSVVPWIKSGSLLDVGTGGGLPGIPLSLVFPDKSITLVDSNHKKTRFLVQCVAELSLKNVTVIHGRVEESLENQFDQIISRAFASIEDFLSLTKNYGKANGQWLAMKGIYPETELSTVKKPFIVESCHPLNVSGEEAPRHLAIITQEGK